MKKKFFNILAIMIPLSMIALLFTACMDNNDSTSFSCDIDKKTVSSAWTVAKSTNVCTLIIADGGAISTDSTSDYLTMLINGIETVIEEGTYSDVELIVTSNLGFIGSFGWGGSTGIEGSSSENYTPPYRTAAYINSSGVDTTKTVSGAIITGTYNGSSATNVLILGQTGDFSGILIDNIAYSITGANIKMGGNTVDGSNTNDFAGLGAAVMVTGSDALLTISDSTIITTGVAKLPIFVDNGAGMVMKNSSITANGGTLYEGYMSTAEQNIMVTPPWVLGLNGAVANARAGNLMGSYSAEAFIDSSIKALGWAGISTDSGTQMHVIAINTDIIVEKSGYGAYNIGSSTQDYYGTKMDVSTYGIIMTGGQATFASYTGGQKIDLTKMDGTDDSRGYGFGTESTVLAKDLVSSKITTGTTVYSSIESDNFGFMGHLNGSSGYNVVNITDGTTVKTGDAVFLVKKVNAVFTVDNSTLESGTGVLVQIIDNDDDYVGLDMSANWGLDNSFYGHTVGSHIPTFNETFHEDSGYSSGFAEGTNATDDAWTCNVTFTNGTYEGNLWNSSGYVGSNYATEMTVTIGDGTDATTLNGVISAGEFSHTEKDYTVGDGDWSNAENLGHVTNQVYFNGMNKVGIVVNSGSTWNVSGTSHITSYTNNGTINGTITAVDASSDGTVDYYKVVPTE